MRRFWLRSNTFKEGKAKPGMEPVILLPLKSKDLKPVIRPKEMGMEPLRLFL